jgi:hypothetical protein
MTTVISGSSPSITFSDATTQTTAFTSTPSVTSITTSADSTIHGITVGLGAGSVAPNTAVGTSALQANTTSTNNTALGYQAAYTQITAGGDGGNTAIGSKALYANNNYRNTAVGYVAAQYTTGASNVAMGWGALTGTSGSSSGGNNVAIGYQALTANTSATNNTAVGYLAGYTNSTGATNTYVGYRAGVSATGSYNTFVGSGATDGAGAAITSGAKNTILGGFNGNQDGVDIRTLDYNAIISDGNGFPYLNLNQASGTARRLSFDGAEFFPATDNAISCGYPSFRWSVVYAVTGTIQTSDKNLKQDIAELDDTEKRVAIAIKSLIKKYRFKESVAEKGDNARIHVCAIAQEVASAFEAEGLDPTRYGLFCSNIWYEVDGNKLNPGGGFYKVTDESVVAVTQLGLRYEELLAFVISAM